MQRQFLRALALFVMSGGLRAATILDSGSGFGSYLQTFAETQSNGSDTPGALLVLNSSAQTYNVSQTASAAGSTGSASVSALPGGGNIGLHGSASAAASSSAQGGGGFNIYWYDSFSISGSGWQTFQYSLVLDALATIIGDPTTDHGSSYGAGQLDLYANSSFQGLAGIQTDPGCSGILAYVGSTPKGCGQLVQDLVNTQSSVFNGTTITGDLSLQGGTSIELGLYLAGSATAYNFPSEDPGSANIQATFNASDTGYFTLIPLSPGESFTTQSGLTYQSSPDAATPEPSTALLAVVGIGGFLTMRRCVKFRSR